MKIAELVKGASDNPLPPIQANLLRYLEDHNDEVFGYRDDSLAEELSIKPSALGFSLWALQQRGLIDKEKVGRKVYFGSHEAITELRRRAAQAPAVDWLERARRTRQKIFEAHGYIDTQALLDEVREGL